MNLDGNFYNRLIRHWDDAMLPTHNAMHDIFMAFHADGKKEAKREQW